MGWLRLVDSIKLEVSFAGYHLFYRALLQKRPIILRRLLIVATPYTFHVNHISKYGHIRHLLQCVAAYLSCAVEVYCSALHCVAVCCSALQCVAVLCIALQCVAVCCSVLQGT